MECQFINLRLIMEEICSSLEVLQAAVQNESGFPSHKAIDNYLEIVIEKYNKLLKNYDNLCSDLFTKNKTLINK